MIRVYTRRQFVQLLAAGVAGASTVFLASCGSGSGSSSAASSQASSGSTGTPSGASPAAAASTPATTPTMTMPMSPVASPSTTPETAAASSGSSPAASTTASSSAPGQSVEVKIVEPSTNFNTWGYQPKSITVKVGTTVVWVNTGGATHTVTADNKAFDSGSIAPNDRFTLKTKTAGTFDYHCAFHPWMKGTLIVTG